jgi:hypothetical protein
MFRRKLIPGAMGMTCLVLLILVSGLSGQIASEPQTKKDTVVPGGKDRGAKTKAGNSSGRDEEGPAFQVVRLKYAQAADLAQVLANLLPPPPKDDQTALNRLVPDVQTNSLLIQASPTALKRILTLVEQLDIPASRPGDDGQRMMTFPLQKLAGDPALQAALSMMLEKNPKAKYTVDPRRNTLLLYGDDKVQAEVNDLIKALLAISEAPRKAPAPVAPPMQIRVLWLVDEQGPGELTGDVAKLVPVLAKLGIKHPRIASNCLVSVNSGSFQVSGRSDFHGGALLRVSGNCRLENERPLLKVDLRVDREKSPGSPPAFSLSSIETEIHAPFGHFVVLGMTPTLDTTSVFVVQINEVE